MWYQHLDQSSKKSVRSTLALTLLAFVGLTLLLLMEVSSSQDTMPGWVTLRMLPMECTPHSMHTWTA